MQEVIGLGATLLRDIQSAAAAGIGMALRLLLPQGILYWRVSLQHKCTPDYVLSLGISEQQPRPLASASLTSKVQARNSSN